MAPRIDYDMRARILKMERENFEKEMDRRRAELLKFTGGTAPLKEPHTMSTVAQKKFFASLAQFARDTAALLDEMSKDTVVGETPAATAAPAAPVAPAKPAKAPKAPAPAVVEAPAAAVSAPAPAKATNGVGDIMSQCRSAAKSYAEVYGRDGLVEVFKKYLPGGAGTMADIPSEKLPELLKELS